MFRTPTSALVCRTIAASARSVAVPRMTVRAASAVAMPTAVSEPSSSSSSTKARTLSNPTLANIEKRWEGMPLQEQADLWMALRDRMQGNWNELTVQEQKAGE